MYWAFQILARKKGQKKRKRIKDLLQSHNSSCHTLVDKILYVQKTFWCSELITRDCQISKKHNRNQTCKRACINNFHRPHLPTYISSTQYLLIQNQKLKTVFKAKIYRKARMTFLISNLPALENWNYNLTF